MENPFSNLFSCLLPPLFSILMDTAAANRLEEDWMMTMKQMELDFTDDIKQQKNKMEV